LIPIFASDTLFGLATDSEMEVKKTSLLKHSAAPGCRFFRQLEIGKDLAGE
jgi:hypothetical protein